METKSPLAKLANWYANSSRMARASLTVILITIGLVSVQLGNWKTTPKMCSLFDDYQLRSNEIQRIQLALGQAGLNGFEVKENQIWVPAAQRATYLKATSDHEGLPAHLQDEPNIAANLNPFMTRSQQKLMERSEKKRQIREMLTRLPFVEQAWFEMDVAESGSAFEPSRQTAVVSIQPIAGNKLSSAEVETVRSIIGGALAGIHLEQIVVTDLNAGRALPHETDDESKYRQASTPNSLDSRKSFFENEIRQVLQSYPGIDLQIHYTAQPRHPKRAREQPRFTPNLEQAPVEDHVVPNGKASIDELCQDEGAPQTSQHFDSHLSGSPVSASVATERVAVSVTVPQRLVEQRFGSTQVKTLFGFPLEESPPDLLDSRFEKLKSEIIEKIRPVLPVSSFNNEKLYPISVTLIRQIAETPAIGWPQAQNLIRHNWPTAAVLVIGLMMLIIVTRSKPVIRSNGTNPLLSFESEAHNSSEDIDPARAEAEQELSRLIEQDPEAAARVIKSWIRKAA